jgi:hypothetical protein
MNEARSSGIRCVWILRGTGGSHHTYGTNYATTAPYIAQGSVAALTLGTSASFAGIKLSYGDNNRLQPLEIKCSSTGGNAMDITYTEP